MKEVQYEPECFNEGVFSGSLVLRKPSINDLFEGSAITQKAKDNEIAATKELLLWSKAFYLKVDIKNCVDGSAFLSFDEMMEDSECLPILQEVAVALVTGISKKKLQATKNLPSIHLKKGKL
jgi:hypothetical protein